MAAILMIDDERAILELVKNGLQKDGHFVTAYTSAAQVPLDKLNRYDLIILDIMMPDVDGFSYCDKIRSLVDCPILFLTAKTMEHDITFGLALGADDYLTKPFRIVELRARVNAHLRRERRERHTALTFDRIKIDLSAKELRVDNTPVALTKSEYLICEYLARNKGQVFSKEQIYEAVFSLEGDSDNSTISTHIKNIRSKLNKLDIQPIATVWGIGYKGIKKTTSLKASFWKFLCMLLIGLIGAVAIPFSLILAGTSTGLITYADYSERSTKNLAPVIAATPDLADVQLPMGCKYLVLG